MESSEDNEEDGVAHCSLALLLYLTLRAVYLFSAYILRCENCRAILKILIFEQTHANHELDHKTTFNLIFLPYINTF